MHFLGGSTMNTQNLRDAISKSKDMTLNFLGRVLSNTNLEPIRDDEGVKGVRASWIGEQGERSIGIDTDEWNAHLTMESDEPPTVEFVQNGDTRSVAIKNVNNISCTVDRDTLDEFVSPRGAAIAVCAGAAAGLLGWFFVSVLRALTVSAKNQDEATIASIPSVESESETTQENQSVDA